MFDIGAPEMVALVILAIVIFGPEKLPKMVGDAARTIRKFREFSTGAREDLKKELGPEFQNLHLEDLNPKTFVRKNLLEGDDDFGLKELQDSLGKELKDIPFDPNAPDVPGPRPGSLSLQKGGPRIQPGERPPYDVDAT